MTINDRYKLLISKLYDNNKAAFARRINVNPTVIENIVGKRGGSPSYKVIESTCANANISADWLITGVGEMLTQEVMKTFTEKSDEDLPQVNEKPVQYQRSPFFFQEDRSVITKDTPGAIPLVSKRAIGGLTNGDMNIMEEDIKGYYVIPKFRFNHVDFLIEVTGDSMIPKIFPGDIVGCSILTQPQYIQWGKMYLLATKEDGLIVKRIKKSSDSNSLLAISENDYYDPFDIPKEDIMGMARVIGVVHLE